MKAVTIKIYGIRLTFKFI